MYGLVNGNLFLQSEDHTSMSVCHQIKLAEFLHSELQIDGQSADCKVSPFSRLTAGRLYVVEYL